MPPCPFCNHDNPIGVRLCSSCGEALPASSGSVEVSEVLREQVYALLADGQKIMAIKLFRERTGVGIKQAKEAVEAIGRGEPLSIPEPVEETFEHQMVGLLDQAQKIAAIKLYRERTGAGLKEAKDAVEAIQRGERPQDPEDGENQFHQILVSLLKQGRKIDAIKVYRAVTGSGLKESKDVIESIAEGYGLSSSQSHGCLGLIASFMVILTCGIVMSRLT